MPAAPKNSTANKKDSQVTQVEPANDFVDSANEINTIINRVNQLNDEMMSTFDTLHDSIKKHFKQFQTKFTELETQLQTALAENQDHKDAADTFNRVSMLKKQDIQIRQDQIKIAELESRIKFLEKENGRVSSQPAEQPVTKPASTPAKPAQVAKPVQLDSFCNARLGKKKFKVSNQAEGFMEDYPEDVFVTDTGCVIGQVCNEPIPEGQVFCSKHANGKFEDIRKPPADMAPPAATKSTPTPVTAPTPKVPVEPEEEDVEPGEEEVEPEEEPINVEPVKKQAAPAPTKVTATLAKPVPVPAKVEEPEEEVEEPEEEVEEPEEVPPVKVEPVKKQAAPAKSTPATAKVEEPEEEDVEPEEDEEVEPVKVEPIKKQAVPAPAKPVSTMVTTTTTPAKPTSTKVTTTTPAKPVPAPEPVEDEVEEEPEEEDDVEEEEPAPKVVASPSKKPAGGKGLNPQIDTLAKTPVKIPNLDTDDNIDIHTFADNTSYYINTDTGDLYEMTENDDIGVFVEKLKQYIKKI